MTAIKIVNRRRFSLPRFCYVLAICGIYSTLSTRILKVLVLAGCDQRHLSVIWAFLSVIGSFLSGVLSYIL